MQEVIRTRMLTIGGSLLAAAGLAAAMVAGPALAQDSTGATATAAVENTIEIAAADLDTTLTGAPGAELNDAGTITVKSNNMSGYSVDVAADAAEFVSTDPENNTDTFSVSELSVAGAALDATDPEPQAHNVTTTAESTDDTGDQINVDYAMTMPWVNADTYTAGLTYTATNNS